MVDVGSRVGEAAGRSGRAARNGGWREAFLSRHRRPGGGDHHATAEDVFGASTANVGAEQREPRARSLSRPRARPDADSVEAGFNQQAVLDQDRALLEQLTQRPSRRDRIAVKKPPPPPKVTPYRPRSGSVSATPGPSSPLATTPASGESGIAVAESVERAVADSALEEAAVATAPKPPPSWGADAIGAAAIGDNAPRSETLPVSEALCLDASQVGSIPGVAAAPLLSDPIVPRSGQLFTATDIDSIMDRLDAPSGGRNGQAAEMPLVASGPTEFTTDPSRFVQNFGDISQDFFRSHGMDVPESSMPKPLASAPATEHRDLGCSSGSFANSKTADDFDVPQRKALKEQINAIDSWLEDDFAAREQLSKQPGATQDRFHAPHTSQKEGASTLTELSAALGGKDVSGEEAEIFRKLEDVKRRKGVGEKVSPVTLKTVAAQVKPLLPSLSLEKLVHLLRLFTSARYSDHDLYLRILGEIPMQIKGITPELLTTCVRVLWRLRLHEATYLELFSMEAMNMIRAKRRAPQRPPPRRPPAPRNVAVDATATAAVSSGAVPTPSPPPAEAPSPFSGAQLIYIGNALSMLGSKPPARFMEVYQEQLSLAIPRLTKEECELVCPTLATSQLMPDVLRRSFLERCAQIDAGSLPPVGFGQLGNHGAAPDIAQYQRQAEEMKRREKHFRNLYVIEASVRKETFSFFSSLPNEVRGYLDRLHAESARLPHEGSNPLSAQVAAVLDQLGMQVNVQQMAGPIGLHVVSKACNPRADVEEVVYECSDATAYYAIRQDDRGAAPELTACAKQRHRLLQRLLPNVKLTHIGIWEWQSLSEAQRVNYMVKLQSLQ